MGKNLTIFDTTLRDGEQMPHVVFSKEQKLELAMLFSEFGVAYIDPRCARFYHYIIPSIFRTAFCCFVSSGSSRDPSL